MENLILRIAATYFYLSCFPTKSVKAVRHIQYQYSTYISEVIQYPYKRYTFSILVSSSHVCSQALSHQYNDAQLIVELVDYFVTVEHVWRSLNMCVVLWRLHHIIHHNHYDFTTFLTQIHVHCQYLSSHKHHKLIPG